MKRGSGNFRQLAIQDIIEHVKKAGTTVVIGELALEDTHVERSEVVHDLSIFKEQSDVIVVNRLDDEMKDVREKVYIRDVFIRKLTEQAI